MTVKLTPSNLTYWFDSGCPAAWKFSEEWESLESKEWAERGTLVHAMMEGTILPSTVEDRMARTFYDKLRSFYAESGWSPVYDLDQKPMVEVKQRFRIAPGVDLSRKLDRIVLDEKGRPLNVDWKTTPGYGWKSIVDADMTTRYPQAHGFQSIGYLLPPPKEDWERLRIPKRFKWPTQMVYVVAPLRGPTQVIYYDWSEKEYANFTQATQAVSTLLKRKHYPKVAGKHCHDCRFKALCWQTPGWESGFRRRDAARHEIPANGDDATA